MIKRVVGIALSLMLLLTISVLQNVRAQDGADAARAAKAKAAIAKRGTGKDARVEVRLTDGTSLKGYVSEAGSDSFTLTDSKTGATRTVAYSEVSQVKRSGGGLSTRTWIIIGAAVTASVIVAIIAKPAVCDGGAQSGFPC
jgi:hypothetical protein